LQDEESLYKIISSKQRQDSRYFSLFEYVGFEYLSSNSMKSFIEMISESFDLLTFPIDGFIQQYSSVVCRFDQN
jgi:hypothetical protein